MITLSGPGTPIRRLFCARLLLLLVLAISLGDAFAARGGVQRMALRPGTYHIPPAGGGGGGAGAGSGSDGGSAMLPAFCLDRDKAPPGANDLYSSIGSEHAFVRFGEESMLLDEAIKRGLVNVRGGSGSELSEAGIASHEGMVFENRDPRKRPMTVEIRRAALLSSGDPAHEFLNASDVARVLSDKNVLDANIDPQDAVWAIDTLRRSGSGKVGDNEAKFRDSVRAYQKKAGLPITRELDRATVDSLSEHRSVTSVLRDMDTVAGGVYRTVRVVRNDDPVRNSLYSVHSSDGRLYAAKTTKAMAAIVNRVGAESTGRAVYMFMEDANPADVNALKVSMQWQGSGPRSSVIVTGKSAMEPPTGRDTMTLRDLLGPMSNRPVVTRIGTAIPDRGMFAQEVRLSTTEGSILMTIRAKSREIIDKFLRKLQAIFDGGHGAEVLSYAAAINIAKNATAKDLNMTRAQLDREFKIDTSYSQVAHVDTGLQVRIAGR